MPSASAILDRVIESVWGGDETRGPGGGKSFPDVWADRNRVLLATTGSAEPGKWRTDRTPYLRSFLRAFNDPVVRRIVGQFTPQTGKSEAIDTLRMYVVDQCPGLTLCLCPDLEEAATYNRDRFIPGMQATDVVKRHLLPSPQETKNLSIKFDNMIMRFRGSNAQAGVRSWPYKYVFADEIETYKVPRPDKKTGKQKSSWKDVFVRSDTHAEHKHVLISSPGDEGDGVHALYAETDRRTYRVPCPFCGFFQRLKFSNLRFDRGEDGAWDEELARRTVRYVCAAPHCLKDIDESHKGEMLARGVWMCEANEDWGTDERQPEVEEAEAPMSSQSRRTSVARDDPILSRFVGFQLSTLYSPFAAATWGDIAAEFARNKGVMTREFVTNRLGEPWKQIAERIEVGELSRLRVPEQVGGYSIGGEGGGKIPRDVLGITVTFDVQKDCLYVIARGWGERGTKTWLLKHECIGRTEGGECVEGDDVLDWTFTRVDGRVLPVTGAAMDAGHFTDEVNAFVRRNLERGACGGHVYACIGRSTGNQLIPFEVAWIETDREGKKVKAGDGGAGGGGQRITIKTDYCNKALHTRIRGGGWLLPVDASDSYLRQLVSEQRVRSAGGIMVWQVRPGFTENHLKDCEIYQIGLAEFLKVGTLVEEDLDDGPKGPATRAVGDRGTQGERREPAPIDAADDEDGEGPAGRRNFLTRSPTWRGS